METRTGYFVFYVEGGSPKIRRFKNKIGRDVFALNFLLDSRGNEDNWVDALVNGSVSSVEIAIESGDEN
jgi:hypothetical protein